MPEEQSWAQGGDFLWVTQLVELGSKKVGRSSRGNFARYGDPQGMRRQGVNSAHVCFCPSVPFPASPVVLTLLVFVPNPFLYRNLFFG